MILIALFYFRWHEVMLPVVKTDAMVKENFVLLYHLSLSFCV
jgi:hypothetical protein